MTLVHRQTGSGLILAEQGGDEASISRALKEIDDRYVLQKHPGDVEGGWVYKVFCVWSEDHDAEYVLSWADDYGRPLPLSSGLIEEVKRWRPENRHRRGLDADAHNQQLRERTAREHHEQLLEISADHRPKVERGRVTVGMSTRSKKPGFQRNTRPPQSGGGRR